MQGRRTYAQMPMLAIREPYTRLDPNTRSKNFPMQFFIRKASTATEPSALQAVQPSRRAFLQKTGVGLASASLLLAACDDDDEDDTTFATSVSLGSGDLGVLNYAYALEQLEAAFYAQVLNGSYYAGASAIEKAVLVDLEAHERAHREFFKAAISTVGTPIGNLEPNFSTINFNDRTSVLMTAQAFEDLGVSAYNGAGRLLTNSDYLTVAGKIVSVEARHAAVIRDLLAPSDPKAFAGNDVVDAMGLDKARTPAEVLAIAGAFVKTTIDASGLPR